MNKTNINIIYHNIIYKSSCNRHCINLDIRSSSSNISNDKNRIISIEISVIIAIAAIVVVLVVVDLILAAVVP